MLLHEIVEFSARRTPGAPALVFGEQTTTFRELDQRITAVAGGLQQLADPGDRVAFIGENSPAWIECYYGIPKAGMVLTMLNHRLTGPELTTLLEHSGARIVMGDAAHLARIDAPAQVETMLAVDEPRSGTYQELVARDHTWAAPMAHAADTAWLVYTSGTTGLPKAAKLTHAGILAGVVNTALARPIAPDDVYLFPFPLCHVSGYNLLIFHLHGRPTVVLKAYRPREVVHAIQANAVTCTSHAPTMLAMLLDHLDDEPAELPTLRSIWYGASAISGALLRRAMRSLAVDFHQGYGMTEMSANGVFLGPAEHRRAAAGDDRLLASAGRPGPLLEIKIVDEDDHELPVGSIGEIAVKGDQLMAGYWNPPPSSPSDSDPIRDGWFRTGDVGRVDEDGYLFVVDRKKDVIITGGENVSSKEVEDAIATLADVADVAVVAAPHERWGECVCAVVVRAPGTTLTEEQVVSAVAERLASFKKPRRVVFVDELPRNATGKVLKPLLRAQLGDTSPGDPARGEMSTDRQ